MPQGPPQPTLSAEPSLGGPPQRVTSIDAFRGLVMLAMVSSGLGFAQTVRENPHLQDSALWQTLAYHFEHVRWVGCAFWDLIQPSFMFLVGAAVPFSLAARRGRGQSWGRIVAHAAWRSGLLVFLGVFLASNGRSQPEFIFTNVLAQIGLGYLFVLALAGRLWIVQFVTLLVILGSYWLAFYLYPAPPTDMNYAVVGFEDFEPLTGLFAHWNPNTNFAWWVDHWLLNQFPRAEPWEFNAGGYHTLNFVPSIATMVLGLMAGELIRGSREASDKVARLFLGGVFCLVVGWAAGHLVCPIVKRIWTPSWALYSGGWTLLILAGAYLVIDVMRWKRWAWPMTVVGMNSIAIYMLAQLSRGWTGQTWRTWGAMLRGQVEALLGTEIGQHVFDWTYGPIVEAVLITFTLWLVAVWLWRRQLFLRI